MLFLFCFSLACAAYYYVAPPALGGNDAASGTTMQAPLATLSAVALKVQQGDTVHIASGVYRETLEPTASGTEAEPIVWRFDAEFDAAVGGNGELPRITGTDVVTLAPSGTTGEYVGAMPFSMTTAGNQAYWDKRHHYGRNQVFLNGQMLTEARMPNVPTTKHVYELTRDDVHTATASHSAVQDGQPHDAPRETYPNMTGWIEHPSFQAFATNELRGAILNFLSGCFWDMASAYVTGNTGNRVDITYLRPSETGFGEQNYRLYDTVAKFYVYGHPSLLDADNEWWRDDLAGELRVRLAQYSAASDTLEVLRRRYIMESRGAIWNHFYQLHFHAGSIQMGHLDWEPSEPCDGTWFVDCHFSYITHYQFLGIRLNGENVLVENCTAEWGGHAAFVIDGVGGTVRNTVVRNFASSGRHGPFVWLNGDLGVAEYNTFTGSGGTGLLDIRKSWASVARYNDISDGAHWVFDGGLVFFSRNFTDGYDVPHVAKYDAQVAYNWIHDVYALSEVVYESHPEWPNYKPVCYHGAAGIYFEGKLSNVTIAHNVIWDRNVGAPIDGAPPTGNTDAHLSSGLSFVDWIPYYDVFVYYNTLRELKLTVHAAQVGAGGKLFEVVGNAAHDMQRGAAWEDHTQFNIFENNTFVQWPAPNAVNYQVPDLQLETSIPFAPKATSPLCDKMLDAPAAPYVDMSPDGGAISCDGSNAFVAGARVLERQLRTLSVDVDTSANASDATTWVISFAALPFGRRIDWRTTRVQLSSPPPVAVVANGGAWAVRWASDFARNEYVARDAAIGDDVAAQRPSELAVYVQLALTAPMIDTGKRVPYPAGANYGNGPTGNDSSVSPTPAGGGGGGGATPSGGESPSDDDDGLSTLYLALIIVGGAMCLAALIGAIVIAACVLQSRSSSSAMLARPATSKGGGRRSRQNTGGSRRSRVYTAATSGSSHSRRSATHHASGVYGFGGLGTGSTVSRGGGVDAYGGLGLRSPADYDGVRGGGAGDYVEAPQRQMPTFDTQPEYYRPLPFAGGRY